MIKINHLCKKYENSIPLKDINTTIYDGDIISIIGPSGTGKSTLLRCINMLEKPTSGSVIIDNIDITDKKNHNNPARLKMGMVFQSFNLFPNMTVIENVMKPQIDILKRNNQYAYDKAIENLRLVGMDGRAMKYPDTLSGGQKQRVAIARTLSMDPEIILFDEPTSALDPIMVEEVQSVIRELSKLGRTMLIVTHEMKFAREICNRVFYLDEGIIYEEGTPEEVFDNPKKERTRRFVKRLKVFEKVIENRNFNYTEYIGSLSRYGYKNHIDHDIIHKLESCFEELCVEILLPNINNPTILFTSEYNDTENTMIVSVSYNGEYFDPLTSENKLSLSILNSLMNNPKHMKIDDNKYTNKFIFELKQ